MSEEAHRITEKGVELALEILERGGYLPEATDSIDVDTAQLKAACTEYIEASVAKGSARSNEECRDAILIAYLNGYLEDLLRRIVN